MTENPSTSHDDPRRDHQGEDGVKRRASGLALGSGLCGEKHGVKMDNKRALRWRRGPSNRPDPP
jgi:hypothetical protein